MTTGPQDTRYQIPDITLGDTFNEWRTTTNDGIIDKLNRMKVYTAASGDGINVTPGNDGNVTFEHSGHVTKGVTFSGNVTFNGAYTVINANEFSIDDYIIMLGATMGHAGGSGASGGGSGAADSTIAAVGGGGLQILRNQGHTASFLWKPDAYGGTGSFGPTGTWYLEGPHVGLTKDAWFVSEDNTYRFHSNKKQSGNSGEGFVFGPDSGSNPRNTYQFSIQSTAGNLYRFIDSKIHSSEAGGGATQELHSNLVNSSIHRVVSKTGHGFTFGYVVRYDPTGFTLGIANNETGAETIGVISKSSGNTFEVGYYGEIIGDFSHANHDGFTPATGRGTRLVPGSVYFLSDEKHGKITSITPTQANNVNKPVLLALDPVGGHTSDDRALLVNYRGALIPSEDAAAPELVQNRIFVQQVNDFVVGDLVRFEKDVHYGWSGGDGITGTQFYSNGVWQRGQANSKEEAEVVGIVTAVNVANEANNFYVTLNGKFDIEDAQRREAMGLTSGMVYFLSANSAPDGKGGMGFSAESLTSTPPLTDGHVKKPWAVSISDSSLIILNYVGEVIGQGVGGGGGGGTVVTSPVGSIIAYGGTAEEAPDNWKFCDGSVLEQSRFQNLFGEIGHQYARDAADVTELTSSGDFRLPDIRNRIIVGENKDNPEALGVIGLTFDAFYGDPMTHGITLGERGGEMNHSIESGELPRHWHWTEGTNTGNAGSDDNHSHTVTSVTLGAKTGVSWNAIKADYSGSDAWWDANSGGGSITDPDATVSMSGAGSEGNHNHSLPNLYTNGRVYDYRPHGASGDFGPVEFTKKTNIMQPYIGLRYIIKVRPDESAGGLGITTVLDSGRNLLVNGNFDFWQRMHHDENNTSNQQAGRSADKFQSNQNDIGGAWLDHNETMFLSRRFFADRWGLKSYGVWNNKSTNGGVSRHKFDLSSKNNVLPALQKLHAESKPAKYYLRLTSTQTNASALADPVANTGGVTGPGIEQRIEGVDRVYNDKATLSFWAKRNAGTQSELDGFYVELSQYVTGTGDYKPENADGTPTSIVQGGGGVADNIRINSPVVSQKFRLNSTWSKYVYTFDVPNIAGLSAGTAGYRPPADWQTMSGGGAIPREGFLSVAIHPVPEKYGQGGATDKDRRWKGEFDLAQVQFERGSVETEFDEYSLHDEQKRCERYYQKSFGPQGCTANRDTETGMQMTPSVSCVEYFDRSISDTLHGSHEFKTTMRHEPRVQIFSLQGTEGSINGPDESGGDWSSSGQIGIQTGRVRRRNPNADSPYNSSVSKSGFGEIQFNVPTGVDGGAGQTGKVWSAGADPTYLSDFQLGHFAFHYIAEAEI